jgi:hypothetical protein
MVSTCPVGYVCIDYTSLGIIIALICIIIVIIYTKFVDNTKNCHNMQNLWRKMNDEQKQIVNNVRNTHIRDNSFNEQEKRSPYVNNAVYGSGVPGKVVNVKTRGEPEQFHKVGILTRTVDPSSETIMSGISQAANVLPLYGRATYPGSNMWEYYVDVNGNQVPITHNNRECLGSTGCSELYDGSSLSIGELDGSYTYKSYPNQEIRYLPSVF